MTFTAEGTGTILGAPLGVCSERRLRLGAVPTMFATWSWLLALTLVTAASMAVRTAPRASVA